MQTHLKDILLKYTSIENNKKNNYDKVLHLCLELKKGTVGTKNNNLQEISSILKSKDVAIFWEDSFTAAGEESSYGLVMLSTYSKNYISELFDIQKKYGKSHTEAPFFYSYFLKTNRVRRLQILERRGFNELPFSDKEKFSKLFTKSITDNFKTIILIHEDSISMLKPMSNSFVGDKQDIVVNDFLEPVSISNIEKSIKYYFKKEAKFIYLYTDREKTNIVSTSSDRSTNQALSFFNVNRFPAGIMLSPFPIILIRISFIDESYLYATYDIRKDRISDKFFPEDSNIINFIKQRRKESIKMGISPLYEPTEQISVETKVWSLLKKRDYINLITRSQCEKLKNRVKAYLLEKFIDGYKIRVLVKDFDTIVIKENDYMSEDDFDRKQERNRALKIKPNRVVTISPYIDNEILQVKQELYKDASVESISVNIDKLNKPVFLENFLDKIRN